MSRQSKVRSKKMPQGPYEDEINIQINGNEEELEGKNIVKWMKAKRRYWQEHVKKMAKYPYYKTKKKYCK